MIIICLLCDNNAVPVNQVGGCWTQKPFFVLPFIMFWNVAADFSPSDLFLQSVPE